MEGHIERSISQQQMLRSVIEGERIAHVWTSPLFEGAEMKIVYAWPDVEVGAEDHCIQDSEFAAKVKLEYAGQMTRERAVEKLAGMRLARSEVEAA